MTPNPILVGVKIVGQPDETSVRLLGFTANDTPGQRVIDIAHTLGMSAEQFGAIGDGGTTDDTAALQKGLDTIGAAGGGALILGAKNYRHTGLVMNYPNIAIIGQGNASILSTVTNAPALIAQQEQTLLANFKILGNGVGANQDGIRSWVGTSGVSRWAAINVECNTLGSYGFYNYYGGPTLYLGPQLTGCRSISCGVGGYACGTEYTVYTNCSDALSVRGFELDAGNVCWSGGSLSNNTTGIYQPGGGNDGHGTISNVLINHCATALNIGALSGLANGMLFQGCQIFNGIILLKNTHKVHFANCFIDVDNYNFDGAVGTVFSGCTFLNAAGPNTVNNAFNAHASTTFADRWCTDLNGNASSVVANAGWSWAPRGGSATVNFATDANKTTAAADYTNDYLNVTSGVSLTATRNLIVPVSAGAQFTVFNNTTGAQSIQVIGASGTGVTIANGKRAIVRCDGTNYVRITADT